MGTLNIIGTWIIVVLILVLVWWCARKLMPMSQKTMQSKYMKLIDRIVISQDKSVMLVQIGEKYYLLGVASSSITMLAQLDEDEIIQFSNNAESLNFGLNFKELLQKAGGKDKNGGKFFDKH